MAQPDAKVSAWRIMDVASIQGEEEGGMAQKMHSISPPCIGGDPIIANHFGEPRGRRICITWNIGIRFVLSFPFLAI